MFNAQTLITPADYATGTTSTRARRDRSPGSSTPTTSRPARFSRNDAWWGGPTPLDGIEFIFFDETGPMVTAYQGGQVDAIVQFDVFSGAALFDDPNFKVNEAPTTNHRQIWMRTDTGQFTDKRVRQALALSLDRDAMVQQLFKGKARSPTTTSSSRSTRTSTRRAAADARRREGQAAAGGRRRDRPDGDVHAGELRRSRTSRSSSRARRRRPGSP